MAKCPNNCFFLQRMCGYQKVCGFLEMTNEPRECEPGPDCKRYVPKLHNNRGYKSRIATWDTELGHQMWLDGKSDREIAEAVHTARQNVAAMRRSRWQEK